MEPIIFYLKRCALLLYAPVEKFGKSFSKLKDRYSAWVLSK